MQKIKALKAIKILLVALLFFFGPTSCFFVEKCPPSFPYFSIKGLKIDNLEYTGVTHAYPWQKVAGNGPVKWNNYFLQVQFEKTFFAKTKTSGGANLYALSCIGDGEFGAKIGVDTLYLIALKDYNANYLQHDTLNRIALANYRTISPEDFTKFFPLARFVKENKNSVKNDMFELKLTEQPAVNNGEYQFKVVFHLKDGKTYEKETPVVRLNK